MRLPRPTQRLVASARWPIVFGAALAWGRTFISPLGLRSEYIRPVAVSWPEPTGADTLRAVKALASRLGLRAVPGSELWAAGIAAGRPCPLDLWPSRDQILCGDATALGAFLGYEDERGPDALDALLNEAISEAGFDPADRAASALAAFEATRVPDSRWTADAPVPAPERRVCEAVADILQTGVPGRPRADKPHEVFC